MDKHQDYFEGVLQLRDPRKEIKQYIRKIFSDAKRPDVWISKEEKVRGGIDFYVSSQKFLRGLGHKIQDKFGGEIKNSRKIHTRDKQSGKDLYRAFLLFRPSKYVKGQVIEYRGEKIKIISAVREIYGINLKTKKKVHIKFDKL